MFTEGKHLLRALGLFMLACPFYGTLRCPASFKMQTPRYKILHYSSVCKICMCMLMHTLVSLCLLLTNEVRKTETVSCPDLIDQKIRFRVWNKSPQHAQCLGFRFTSPDVTIMIITKLSNILVSALEKQLGEYQEYTLLLRENEWEDRYVFGSARFGSKCSLQPWHISWG